MRVRRRFVASFWQKDLLLVVGLCLLAGLFLFKIGSLLPGASQSEITARADTTNIQSVMRDPLYLPHKLPMYGLQKLGVTSIDSLRIISAGFAVIFVVAFHRLIRKWHSRRIAAISTLLLATSSWLLTIGRSATPTILLTSWFLVIALLLWFRHSRKVRLAPPLLLLLLSILLYIPGTIYLIGMIVLWYASKAPRFFKYMKKTSIALGVFFALVLLSPLILAFVKTPSLISEWLLLPESLSFADFITNLRNLMTTFFYQSGSNPEFWLGRLPLLDAFTGTMMLLGIYAYRYHLRMERTPLIGLVLLLGVIVVGAAGPQLVFLLLPFVYILVANGIAFLLEQWFTVFPKNPVPRALATTLLSVAVIVTGYYHLSRYFVAWPNTPATKTVYSVKD